MPSDPPTTTPTSGQRTTMTERGMKRIISGVTSGGAREDPSACINILRPLIDTAEGRKFLSKQEGEKALVLIELFDWALKSRGIPLNKGSILWTLRQLCACRETLPRSCVLQIEFKTSDPHHAAGGFADVWKGSYDGREVAFKSIRGSTQTDDVARLKRKRRFCKEVILWKSLNHPNILGLVGVCRWDDTPDARLTMVSEWMTNGNITEYIKHNESQRMQLLIDCAKGVQYLHRMNLVHGDLKGANILITSDHPVRACLADFGFMTIVYDDASKPDSTTALGGGTTPFMAPELLSPSMFGRTKCQVSKEADVYAFGMVTLQVLTGLMPFHTLRDTEISYKVIRGDRPEMPTDAKDSGISEGLWQLLARCWNAKCTQRPLIDEILRHFCHDPARGLIFPPSRIPQAPSCESVFESGTQKYGNGPRFEPVCWCAHSPIAEMFVTASPQTPTEGMFGATLWTICFNASSVIRIPTLPYAHESYGFHRVLKS
ncbi:kinase-like protein [Thelephora ganbajun]|uniref:Kinase-like protein n=1 Tax=Thelephora ganbajun TaxID=370292 RepID=A0ACB6ZDE4_THEGA|nr:kinase-like protein [Thelephora ganbajun]